MATRDTVGVVPGVGVETDELRAHWGWFLGLGIVSLVLGILAIVVPVVATLAVELLIGWLLIISGVAQLIQAFRVRSWRGAAITVLTGVLALGVGLLMVFFPLAGILSLTLLVTAFLLLGGAFRLAGAYRLHPAPGWGWLLFGGLVALLLAVLILIGWPSTAAWVLGLFVGIDLIFAGLGMLTLAQGLRREEALDAPT